MNIFDFSDYKKFLKSWIFKVKKEKKITLSKLAEIAHIHSTYLSHVISGDKDLSLEQAALISQFIGFTPLEQEYFFLMIQESRAGNKVLKTYLKEKIVNILNEKNNLTKRFEKHLQLTEQDRVIFYSSWIYVSVWAATSIADGQTVDEIANRFRITRQRADQILNFLVQCQACEKKDNLYCVGQAHIHLPNESPLVVKHHTNWRLHAMKAMDDRTNSELFFTSPLTLSEKDFIIIREKLNDLIKETVKITMATEPTELVCLNIDYFKLRI